MVQGTLPHCTRRPSSYQAVDGPIRMFTEKELIEAVEELKTKRAAGPDGVPPEAV